MAARIEVIVGLGNPGAQYEATRHNAGWWFVDQLAGRYAGRLLADTKFFGELCRVTVGGVSCWLLKPTTFMNRSGQAVHAVMAYHKIALENILVIHDDLDLPPGVARIKCGGGHGGHNGLRSIIASCGGNDFMRLRLGIGHPGDKAQVANFVLHKTPSAERELIVQSMEAAEEILPWLLAGDSARAMNQLHAARNG